MRQCPVRIKSVEKKAELERWKQRHLCSIPIGDLSKYKPPKKRKRQIAPYFESKYESLSPYNKKF